MVATLALIAFNSGASHAQDAGFDFTIHVGSLVMDVGEDGSVDLRIIDIAEPAFSWAIDVTYDTDVVSVVECLPRKGGICDLDLGAGSLRVTSASAQGLTRDTVLAEIMFRCSEEGESPLTLGSSFGNVGIAVFNVTMEDGNVTCQVAALPKETSDMSLPSTGAGSRATRPDWPSVFFFGAGGGLLLAASIAALRRRYA